MTILTKIQAIEIRKSRQSKSEIARRFKVSEYVIHEVLCGNTFKDKSLHQISFEKIQKRRPEDTLLKLEDICREHGIGVNMLRRRQMAKDMPKSVMDRHLRYYWKSDVDEWLRNGNTFHRGNQGRKPGITNSRLIQKRPHGITIELVAK